MSQKGNANKPNLVFEEKAQGSPTEQREMDVIKKEIKHHWQQAEQSYLEVGKLLIEAKKQVDRGVWLEWLKDNTEISAVRAQRLMRLAEEYSLNTSPVTHLGFSKASILLTLPKDEREAFVGEAHNVDGAPKNVADMSKRELEKVVREHKKSKSPNNPKEQSDSDSEQEDDGTKDAESVDWAQLSPITFLIGKVLDFENVVDDVLGMLATQMDNAEEQNELVSKLRSICDKALRELPPVKSDAEKLSA